MILVLLAILFCLALQRFANVGGFFKVSWFEVYLKLITPWVAKLDVRLVMLAVVMPVLLLFVLIHIMFSSHWFNLVDLLLAVLVLFVCIDARDLKVQLIPYFKALDKADAHGAAQAVTEFIDEVQIDNMTDLHRFVTKAILLRSFERLFSRLFWFMALGIYGLSVYFLIGLINQSSARVNPTYVELEKLAAKIQNILDWVPARLLGFSYALVGHFRKGFGYVVKHLASGLSNAKVIVVDAGLNSLDVDSNPANADKSENEAALDLVNRALIIWLVGLVLVLIGAWL